MQGKIISALIIAAIAACCFFIIRKRIRDIKRGKYCSCHDCGDCCNCKNKK